MKNVRTQYRYKSSVSKINRDNVYGGFDYRKAYFKKNRGIFGYLYICSQCFKPMINKTNIKVDHIIPPSRFAKKKRHRGINATVYKATMISECLNHTFNCVTICASCNSSKSNRIDHRVLKGISAKVIELGLKTTQLSLSVGLFVSLHFIRLPFIGAAWVFRRNKKRRRRR